MTATEAALGRGLQTGEALDYRERQRYFHVATTTADLLDNLREGMSARLYRVSDGVHTELYVIPFWEGGRLIYHREEAALPRTEKEIDAAHSIPQYAHNIVTRARELVMTEKQIEVWRRDDVPGGKHHILPLEVKAAALRLQIAMTDFALKEAENSIDPLNRVPFGVAADLQFEIDTRRHEGEVVTQEWVDARLHQMLSQTQRAVRPQKRADARLSSPKSQKGFGLPFGISSAGLPDIVQTAAVDPAIAYKLSASTIVGLGALATFSIISLVACEPTTVPTPQAPIPPGATEVPLTPGQGQKTPEPAVQRTPANETAIPSILATPTEVLSVFVPPVHPPEYVPGGSGGVFPEAIQEQARLDRYRALLVLARQDGEIIAGVTNQEVFNKLDAYATGKGVHVKQEWNGHYGDRYQMASINVQTRANGSQLVYWYATSGGALSARPDIPSSADSQLAGIEIPVGFHPEWRWGSDNHVYMFLVDNATGVPGAWFNTTEADALAEGGLAAALQHLIEPATATPEVVTADDIVEMLHGLTNDQLDNKTEVIIPTNDGNTIIVTYEALFSQNGPLEKYQLTESAKQDMALYIFGRLAFFRHLSGASGYDEIDGITTSNLGDPYILINAVRQRLAKGTPYTVDVLGTRRIKQFHYDNSFNDGLMPDTPITGITTAYLTQEEFRQIELTMGTIPYMRINRYLSPNIPSPDIINGNIDPAAEEMMIFIDKRGILHIVYHNEIRNAFATNGWQDMEGQLEANPRYSLKGLASNILHQMFKPLEDYPPGIVYNWVQLIDLVPDDSIGIQLK